MIKFCQPAATVPAPTSSPLMKRALGMTPQRSKMARTIPKKEASSVHTLTMREWRKKEGGWTYLARKIGRWQIWLWGTWAPVRTAWAGHLLRSRRGRERRGPGWLRSYRWLWYRGILHSHCKEIKIHKLMLSTYPCNGFWLLILILTLNYDDTSALMREPPSSNKKFKLVCAWPSYFQDASTDIYIWLSACLYPLLHSREPLWGLSCDYTNYSGAVWSTWLAESV